MYIYCVRCTLFPPVAEICARLAGNFCQYMTTVSCRANSLVWVAVCYFTAASRVGEGGGVWQLCLHSVIQPYTTWPRWREGGCVPSPWYRWAPCRLHICTYRGLTGTGMCRQGRMKRKKDCIESSFQYAPCGYRCGGGIGYSTWTRVWILTFWCVHPPKTPQPVFFEV